jgi:hypothetical protein
VVDLSLFAQTLGGAQAFLEAIQEFELWIGLKVNRKRTCAMVVERRGKSHRQMDETLVYMGQEVTSPRRRADTWGGMGNTNRRYVKHERENLQEN